MDLSSIPTYRLFLRNGDAWQNSYLTNKCVSITISMAVAGTWQAFQVAGSVGLEEAVSGIVRVPGVLRGGVRLAVKPEVARLTGQTGVPDGANTSLGQVERIFFF